MASFSAEQLAQAAFDLKLIDDRQLRDVWSSLGSRNVSLEEFSETLLRRELLTGYQLNRLQRGEKKGFFFGNYKILYLVGRGSFARVYRAVHTVTGEVVALKVVRRKVAANPQKVQDFYHEGEVGLTLRHPNIVAVQEVAKHDKSHFLVMEFVEGRNLREFIKIRKQCAPDEAIHLIKDVEIYIFENFDPACEKDMSIHFIGKFTKQRLHFVAAVAIKQNDLLDTGVDQRMNQIRNKGEQCCGINVHG